MGYLDALMAGGGLLVDLANLRQQKETQEYMKAAQEITWSREDNAIQRRAADLKAAGINPILAAGSAASSSSPVAVGTPQMSLAGTTAGLQAAMALTKQKADIAVSAAEERRINQEARRISYDNQIMSALDNARTGDGKSVLEDMGQMKYLNALNENAISNATAELVRSQAEKAATEAASAKRDLNFRQENNVYGGESTELAAMTKYLDGLQGAGDFKGILYEIGNKLLDRVIKK